MVFADLDTSSTTYIKTGATLIINVPKEWTEITILGGTSGFNTPTVTTFGDGFHSNQKLTLLLV